MVAAQGYDLPQITSGAQIEIEQFQGNYVAHNEFSDGLLFATANMSSCLRSFSLGVWVMFVTWKLIIQLFSGFIFVKLQNLECFL